MAKSMKRVIACLLAVLMVAFSMPFTALAAAGDYNPDIEVYFYPIYGDALGSYDPVTGSKKGVDPSVGAGSLSDVAFDFKNGTLSATPAKYADYLEYNEMGADEVGVFGEDGTETWTLGAGDFVGAVVVMKNVSTLFATSGAIAFTGLKPAGFDRSLTGSGAKQRNVLTLRALDDEEAEGDWAYEGVSTDVDAAAFYEDMDTEGNTINENGHIWFEVAGGTPCSDVSSVAGGEDFFNPTTGELGYDFTNECILGTFLFQLDGSPITLEAADPNNEIYDLYTGGLYVATTDDGARTPTDLTTVAGGTHAGAGKMTYFAEQSSQPEDTYYTVTYVDADGDTISTEEVIENGSPASIPDLPTSDDAHVTYAWDVNPSGAVITAATTFTQVRTTTDHDWSAWEVTTPEVPATCTTDGTTAIESRTCSICNESQTQGGEVIPAYGHHDYTSVVTEPTCTEQGYTTYTCAEGDDTYVADYVDALGHDLGEWYETDEAVASTCVTAGVSATERADCSRCDYFETRGGEALPLDPNNHENIVDDAAVAPTCTETGLTAGSHCAACDTVIQAQETVDALGHDLTWTETTPAVPATCTTDGATAIETATCSRCDYTETRGGEVVPAYGHHDYTSVVTAPTCTEQGYTTYTCAEGDDTYVADYTDPIGHDWTYGEFVWTGYESATQTRTCQNDASHVETVDAVITSEITTPATADEDGVRTYTATATYEDGTVKTDTKTETIPAAGWEFDSFVWAADYKTAQAKLVSEAGGEKLVDATVTSAVKTAATCAAKGWTTYTATYGENTESKDAEDIEIDPEAHAWGEWTEVEAAVAGTCVEAGKTAVEECVCANDPSHKQTRGGEATTKDPANHNGAATEVINAADATCTEDGYTGDTICSACKAVLEEGTSIPATGHAWTYGEFVWDGFTAATQTRTCQNDAEHVETVDAVITSEITTPATPDEDGEITYTATATYEDGVIKTDTKTDVIPAAGWTFDSFVWADDYKTAQAKLVSGDAEQLVDATVTSAVKTPADCHNMGWTTYTATYEGNTESKDAQDIAKTEHNWGEWTVSEPAVAPTKQSEGKTAVETSTCSICGDVQTRGGEVIPQLGVIITVENVEGGSATFTGGEATDKDNAKSYKYGTEYKITAEAAEGYTFVGWTINDRQMTTDATYSNIAYADLTLKPIFAKTAADNFTVVFYNKFGDVISEQTVANGAEIEVPAVKGFQGYEFAGTWKINDAAGKSAEDIAALTENATVWAEYNKVETGTYTITADGAEITLPAGIENGSIPYNTKAKVTFAGATAIKAGDAIVAYGDTYEFYVGADITLEPVTDDVEETPTIAIVGENTVSSGRYEVVASQVVPAGWTLKDRGFVYGLKASVEAKEKDGEDKFDLDALPADGVRIYRHGTTSKSNQISLTVGVSAGKTVKFYAFVVATKGGTTKVFYSDSYEIAK